MRVRGGVATILHISPCVYPLYYTIIHIVTSIEAGTLSYVRSVKVEIASTRNSAYKPSVYGITIKKRH